MDNFDIWLVEMELTTFVIAASLPTVAITKTFSFFSGKIEIEIKGPF